MGSRASAERALTEAVQLHQRGDLAGAVRAYENIVRKTPGQAVAHNLLGLSYFQLGKREKAAASLEKALSLKPELTDAHYNLGIVLHGLGRYEDAVAHFRQFLASKPDDAEARNSLGASLKELHWYDDAIEQFRKAIEAQPKYAEAQFNLGSALLTLGQHADSIPHLQRAAAARPNFAEAHSQFASALFALGRAEEAIHESRLALALNADLCPAHVVMGHALRAKGRFAEAATHYRRATELEPDDDLTFSALAFCALEACDWSGFDACKAELERRIADDGSAVHPATALAYAIVPALQFQCAQKFIAALAGGVESRTMSEKKSEPRREKIRVAYISSDFRNHVVAHSIEKLIHLHDRGAFEIVGISIGADDGSEVRARLAGSFDVFCDVSGQRDSDAAEQIRKLGADILVDLNGHTEGARWGILARRPAPIQVNYLGYAGTSGAAFVDYIVADATSLPLDQQAFYSEKIVHLPDTFFVGDGARPISPGMQARKAEGLPESGFVFCCFNKVHKITPALFDVWMRLLRDVDGSVLWLSSGGEDATKNLRAEAERRGLDPARLVSAKKVPWIADHLARHRLADLFLDTLPYNAHATAYDALWAGLPVLTCAAGGFHGRVAASQLRAIGLSELVTEDLAAYERLAGRLAREPQSLAGIRDRLAENRNLRPLFDTAQTCRHLEAAYRKILELADRGEGPRHFVVERPH